MDLYSVGMCDDVLSAANFGSSFVGFTFQVSLHGLLTPIEEECHTQMLAGKGEGKGKMGDPTARNQILTHVTDQVRNGVNIHRALHSLLSHQGIESRRCQFQLGIY